MATEKPRYSVCVLTEITEYTHDNLTLSQARKTAFREAAQPHNVAVYVMGYNGQCRVYYNPDGNFGPVGKCWVDYYG